MSKNTSPTLQQFLNDNNVTTDEKTIRRKLRAKFKGTHEHNARWIVTANVRKFLVETLKIDENAS